jgi:hypothetical protein
LLIAFTSASPGSESAHGCNFPGAGAGLIDLVWLREGWPLSDEGLICDSGHTINGPDSTPESEARADSRSIAYSFCFTGTPAAATEHEHDPTFILYILPVPWLR